MSMKFMRSQNRYIYSIVQIIFLLFFFSYKAVCQFYGENMSLDKPMLQLELLRWAKEWSSKNENDKPTNISELVKGFNADAINVYPIIWHIVQVICLFFPLYISLTKLQLTALCHITSHNSFIGTKLFIIEKSRNRWEKYYEHDSAFKLINLCILSEKMCRIGFGQNSNNVWFDAKPSEAILIKSYLLIQTHKMKKSEFMQSN